MCVCAHCVKGGKKKRERKLGMRRNERRRQTVVCLLVLFFLSQYLTHLQVTLLFPLFSLLFPPPPVASHIHYLFPLCPAGCDSPLLIVSLKPLLIHCIHNPFVFFFFLSFLPLLPHRVSPSSLSWHCRLPSLPRLIRRVQHDDDEAGV